MQVTIDRFEGDFAVVEMDGRRMVNIPKILIPDAKEGDIIDISIDKNKTEKRKNEIRKLINDLWAD